MNRLSLRASLALVVVTTIALLAIPLAAMQFTSEVDWGLGDFVAAGLLLVGAGGSYVVATRRVHRPATRALAAGLVLVVSAAIWAELAVGLFR